MHEAPMEKVTIEQFYDTILAFLPAVALGVLSVPMSKKGEGLRTEGRLMWVNVLNLPIPEIPSRYLRVALSTQNSL